MGKENYYYKGFDYLNTSIKEKRIYEYFNPYGYNIDSTSKRIIDIEKKLIKPTKR